MSTPRQQPPARPNRYELPVTSMVGAMVVVLIGIALFVGFRALTRDNPTVTTPTVAWKTWLQQVHKSGQLHGFAPLDLPHGWRATSASYKPTGAAHWHLGMLTGSQKYVGLEEGPATFSGDVHKYVNGQVSRGHDASIGGHAWRTWTSSSGDYALARRVAGPKAPEILLVVGSAPPAQIRDFAGTLR